MELRDVWSIAIYGGTSPLQVQPGTLANPVLTAQHVTDVPALFVADPFMVHADQTWYMFFEVMHAQTRQGEIGCATSRDGWHWTYRQIVLREPFHLSYPYVFKWHDTYYMVPESYEARAVRLYRAVEFPWTWAYEGALLDGAYTDPSLFRWHGMWWMFVCSTPCQHDTLCLYYARALPGPWQAHPQNPLIAGDAHTARPAGRVIAHGGHILRYAQDDTPFYGKQVRAFAITALSTLHYTDCEVPESPVLQGSGTGWNAKGMHHIDPHQIDAQQWLASVDGHCEMHLPTK